MKTTKRVITLAALMSAGLIWGAPESADETSYAAGYREGAHWQHTRAGLDSAAHVQGMTDGLAGAPARYAVTGAVVQAAMQKFDTGMMARIDTNAAAKTAAPVVTGQDAGVAGYTIGYRLGEALRRRGMPMNTPAYARGLADSLRGTAPSIGTNRVATAAHAFHQALMTQPTGTGVPPAAATGK